MISDDVRYQVGAAASVNLDDPDPETARRTDGILSDQSVPGKPVMLRAYRVADLVTDLAGAGQFPDLALAKILGGDHDDHTTR